MSTHKHFKLTPEQIALSEERRAKKLKAATSKFGDSSSSSRGTIIHRTWIPVQPVQDTQPELQRIKVLTWNMPFTEIKLLAQCLIRRDLFPTSDCLKAGQREHMLYRELLAPQADIICLQEVDRLDKLLPVLEDAGYVHHYAAGDGKKHGCLIAFKKDMYTMVAAKLIKYDNENVRSGGNEIARRGLSFRTKNIGSIVSLRSNRKDNRGIIVATTHLFWHPRYTYERARQVGILVREAARFRAELGVDEWACIIGGDFNFAPDDPAYSLITGDPLLLDQEERLVSSYVVHVSVDPTLPKNTGASTEDGEDVDPDRVITSARMATAADGLLSIPELLDLFSQIPRLRSAYDEGIGQVQETQQLSTFGHRVILPPGRHGRHEPEYTSYTHYWKTVLDYIFIMDPADRHINVAGLLSPPRTADLEPGLPRKGVCSSDHISLAADFVWQRMVPL